MKEVSDILVSRCDVSRGTLERLQKFVELLEKWNSKINLIGKSTVSDIWSRHILDSAQLLLYFPCLSCVVTDFGSGGGFPGIVLSLLGVKEIHLVESDSRKAAFLLEASRLSDNKIIVHNERIESLSPWVSSIITARALASLTDLLKLTFPFMGKDTLCFFPKGSTLTLELQNAKQYWCFDYHLYPSLTAKEASIIQIEKVQLRG